MEAKNQTHRYSEGRSASDPMYIYQGFPPVRLFYGPLHPLFCIFYRPLWKVPRRVKWFDFSVDAKWVNHQNNRHSEGRSASDPMFIRGFHLDGYLMTPYTSFFAYFIARCNYSASSKMACFFSRDYGSDQNHRHSEGRPSLGSMFITGFPYMVILWLSLTLYTPCFAYFIARCELFRLE